MARDIYVFLQTDTWLDVRSFLFSFINYYIYWILSRNIDEQCASTKLRSRGNTRKIVCDLTKSNIEGNEVSRPAPFPFTT